MTAATRWKPANLTTTPVAGVDPLPIIEAGDVVKIIAGLDLWDLWPARHADGAIADVCGASLWAALSAPVSDDPSQRHDIAAIRLLRHDLDGSWHDLGPMFEPGTAMGSRQWAGSMIVDGGRLTVYYTAAGYPAATTRSFRQRLYTTMAQLRCERDRPVLGPWTEHVELFAPDDRYDPADDVDGRPGFIKAFRDPFPFVDPATGERHLFFTGSLPPEHSETDFNGVIGTAHFDDEAGAWKLAAPLITADGVNNELERPHMVVHDGRYYLFFSTQARTFHPDQPGPTGLFGFVADDLAGPYTPLNGHGVVFTTPPSEPLQAYSWLVLNDLTVVSFVDAYALAGTGYLEGRTGDVASDPAHFGGTIAPAVRLGLDGTRAWIADFDAPAPR